MSVPVRLSRELRLLDITIVLSGFVIAFGAMGVAFALAVGLGSAKAIQHGRESLQDRSSQEREADAKKR